MMRQIPIRLLIKSVLLTLLLPAFLAAQEQTRVPDFSRETARTSPDWVKDAVIYEIFPRQFSAKGDFNGVTSDLDRLQRLGVTVLWLMPIHPVGQLKKKGAVGSPYAVQDFYAVNPDYGTKEDFKRLVAEAHRRGMKVIIDIVANHTSWDSVMMKTKGFHTTNAAGEVIPPVPDWADVADLNYENPELRKYMIEMLKYWVREFDLDGFRCDVAGFVPTDFWEQARAEVDKIKPDTIWLAEWETPDHLVKAFDLNYSWELHEGLTQVLQGRAPASEIHAIWQRQKSRYPKGALRMRFSDNHDERRAIARFGERGALAGQALAFTLDGVPMLYNGMEVGDTTESGAPALFEKLPIFWPIRERRPEFPRFYQAMINLRKNSNALRRGELVWLKNTDESQVLTFSRRAGGEEILVAINMTSRPSFGAVDAGGEFVEITPDINAQPAADGAIKTVTGRSTLPTLALGPYEFRIFRRK